MGNIKNSVAKSKNYVSRDVRLENHFSNFVKKNLGQNLE